MPTKYTRKFTVDIQPRQRIDTGQYCPPNSGLYANRHFHYFIIVLRKKEIDEKCQIECEKEYLECVSICTHSNCVLDCANNYNYCVRDCPIINSILVLANGSRQSCPFTTDFQGQKS